MLLACQILDAARAGRITLFTTPVLLAELQDVLTRPRLAPRLAQARVDAGTLVMGFAALAVLVRPTNMPPVVLADPDDDAVLACAVAAQGRRLSPVTRTFSSSASTKAFPSGPRCNYWRRCRKTVGS
jgi:predicted nucleic acid-binding protein